LIIDVDRTGLVSIQSQAMARESIDEKHMVAANGLATGSGSRTLGDVFGDPGLVDLIQKELPEIRIEQPDDATIALLG
jgi:hypothetical protein